MISSTESILHDIYVELKKSRMAMEERNKILKQLINIPMEDDLYLKSRDEYLKEIDEEFSND